MVDNLETQNENKYTLSEIYYIIRKHIIKILAVFSVIFLFSIYYTLTTNKVYKSSSVIIISKDQNSMSMLDMGFGSERNFIDNEIEVLKSRSTSEATVKKLLKSEYIDSLYLFGTKKIRLSLLNKISNLFTFSNKDTFNIRKDLNDKYFNIFTKKLKSQISVSSDRNTDAIIVSVDSYSPNEAALLANILIDVYINRDLAWVTGEMSHLKSFLASQLEIKESELSEIEQKLKSFQEKEKIFGLDENSSMILKSLTEFEAEHNKILALINITREKEKYINKQLTSDEKDFSQRVSNTINDRLSALKNELSGLETELITTTTKYDDNHSAVKELRDKIYNIKSKIENETRDLISKGISVADPIYFRQTLMDSAISIQAIKANLISKAESYKKLVNEYGRQLSSLPEKLLEYTRLERVRSIHAETYGFMRQKLEESRIGEASKLSKIRVIDEAIPIKKPIRPKVFFNFISGFGLALIFSIGLAFIIEFFDNTIKSIQQIERRGLQILAIIPSIGSIKQKSRSKKYSKKNIDIEKFQRRLITQEDPKSPISEAYRGLRTSLMYSKKEENCNVMLVSSSGPGEGKTTTVSNLAITYANLGKKTLLIDSDLRKPVVHTVFNQDKTPGLTSYLSGVNSNLKDIINRTDIDNLDVITSGIIPQNPSELLDSNEMAELLKEVKEKYDIVLFDTPPLIAVTDALILLKSVSQFILVIRFGVTQKGALERVISTTDHANIKITGTVLNALTQGDSYGMGYYYNYYQDYYATDSKN